MFNMKRRKFIALLGGVVGVSTAYPSAAKTQQPEPMRRVGILMPYAENDAEYRTHVQALRDNLRKSGSKVGISYSTSIGLPITWIAFGPAPQLW
jgi:hypothetical protein